MTQDQCRALHKVAESRFYQPAESDGKACGWLAENGYIQPIQQGKLNGYCLALAGTVYLRKRGGYECK